MKTLTKEQIEALQTKLSAYGLKVTAVRQTAAPDTYEARLRAWKPETPAGRSCRTGALKNLRRRSKLPAATLAFINSGRPPANWPGRDRMERN